MMMPRPHRLPSGLGLPPRVASPGWPQGPGLPAGPGEGAPALGASRQGGMVVLQGQAASSASQGPLAPAADEGPLAWAGAWLGMAWGTCRSGLLRLAEAMGPGRPVEAAAQEAAVAGLELVGSVAQVAVTPCIAAVGLGAQALGQAAQAGQACLGVGAGWLASWAEAAEGAWQAFRRAFKAAAEAI